MQLTISSTIREGNKELTCEIQLTISGIGIDPTSEQQLDLLSDTASRADLGVRQALTRGLNRLPEAREA